MARTTRFVVLLAVLLVVVRWFTPVLFDRYCITNHQSACEFAIRGAHQVHDVPPAPDFRTRFPLGYLTALRMCRWPIYSQREKTMALNVLAGFVYYGDEDVPDLCLAEIRRMQADPSFTGHCQWLLSIGVIKERIEHMR